MILPPWVSTTTTVMQTLEDHGVTAFDASWDDMVTPVREALTH
jgi:hypothetical protein